MEIMKIAILEYLLYDCFAGRDDYPWDLREAVKLLIVEGGRLDED